MNKIGWCDITRNPVKGCCPVACPYCYARRMYNRFKWDKTIRLNIEVLWDLPGKPSRIFVGSTMELFGEWVPDEWMRQIIKAVDTHPQHTFQFLTKQPQNLAKWNPWPDNAWVGMSITDESYSYSVGLKRTDAKVKFVSFEPLLGSVNLKYLSWVDWLIIGAETGNRKGKPLLTEVHKWAGEIIEAADEAGVPVFLKDNLKWPEVRREWPNDTA